VKSGEKGAHFALRPACEREGESLSRPQRTAPGLPNDAPKQWALNQNGPGHVGGRADNSDWPGAPLQRAERAPKVAHNVAKGGRLALSMAACALHCAVCAPTAVIPIERPHCTVKTSTGPLQTLVTLGCWRHAASCAHSIGAAGLPKPQRRLIRTAKRRPNGRPAHWGGVKRETLTRWLARMARRATRALPGRAPVAWARPAKCGPERDSCRGHMMENH